MPGLPPRGSTLVGPDNRESDQYFENKRNVKEELLWLRQELPTKIYTPPKSQSDSKAKATKRAPFTRVFSYLPPLRFSAIIQRLHGDKPSQEEA